MRQLRVVDCEVDGLAVHRSHGPPLRFALEAPEILYIFLNHVAWGRLPETTLPPDLVSRMEQAETIVLAGGRVIKTPPQLKGEPPHDQIAPGESTTAGD